MKHKKQSAFTIVELLVFLAVLFIGLFVYLWLNETIIQEERTVLTSTLIQSPKINKPKLENEEQLSTAVTTTTTTTEAYAAVNWLPFTSAFFTLSFRLPSDLETKEEAGYLLIAPSPYSISETGADNAFFRLTKYDADKTRETQLAMYKKLLTNTEESVMEIDGMSFKTLSGEDWGRFEGESAGKVTVVFFNASWLEIIERPLNNNQTVDFNNIGKQILATFQFSK